MLAGLVCGATPATAQQASENAIASAEDAFGNRQAHESIGIYDAFNVRGFSPTDAGNVRLSGLYFEDLGETNGHVIDSETIRVGSSVQSYPFPSPTGIVDLQLRTAEPRLGFTPYLSVDTFGSKTIEVDGSIPLISDALGVAAGAGIYHSHYPNGAGARSWNVGIVPRWTVSGSLQITAVYSHDRIIGELPAANYIVEGAFLPPRIPRGSFPGPFFARTTSNLQTLGLIAKGRMASHLELNAGLFRSGYWTDSSFSNDILVSATGDTIRRLTRYRPQRAFATSGEIRLTYDFADGRRTHRIMVSVRGRRISDRTDDGLSETLGAAPLSSVFNRPASDFRFDALNDVNDPFAYTRLQQGSAGLAYDLDWPDTVALSLSLQRAIVRRRAIEGDASVRSPSQGRWLPGINVTVPLASMVSLYASHVRGLENTENAPSYASNAFEMLPPVSSTQYDFGARISPSASATLIVGYYFIRKPYFALDRTRFYGRVGEETHQGIELSLNLRRDPGLHLLVGGTYAWDHISAGRDVEEPIGSRPLGQPRLNVQIAADYAIAAVPNVSIDGDIHYTGSRPATLDNSISIRPAMTINLGLRYLFDLAGRKWEARVKVSNILDAYSLRIKGNGVYGYEAGRSGTFSLTYNY